MRTVPSLPWWGWALIAFFVLNVLLDMNVGIFVPIILGWVAAGVLGQRRSSEQNTSMQNRPDHPLPPPTQSDEPIPGWTGGSGLDATAPPPIGPAGEAPMDSPSQHRPGHSPWVHRPGEAPGAGATPATGTPGPGMPKIEVPQYPDANTPPPAYPSAGTSTSTDPVVSLGQLHLSRCARDLHTAATAGSAQDVSRVLEEVKEQAERLLGQLSGAGALPGSGRREFESGLRRLQRDVAAARGEDPPGPKAARVVRAAGAMGQTGRYE
ncbi:hypothetical protein [Ornithinimicrobium pratense]|uniref:Uncharacterized protein n=1 Tax=Ornithinimicrobium pratense TaxID=2593973 RepID=A0A5J6V723_9MICO|nr:hypothetical protein [Ornithinimicrobium pratense]QFG69114.1 hypothetical protein FY030_10715 [Ornithinimicrobium pratense]